MRNLKRVLALALALIMTLGLMITASAASYADADQIDANYGEAIEVLTNMGVFRGQANGGESTEFAPKDILTRAEAATLVYRLLTADVTDAKKSNYDYTSFDDVKEGEWWTGYITYAANGKYVVGYGNGKFGPNDQVTGIEVLTIMLRALGYGQNGEFVGGGWKDHVLTTANENGMLKGVATDDLDKGASRELVAQLLFNAITVPKMVNYAPLTGYSKTAQTLGEKNFGLIEIEGVVTANEYADLYDTKPLAEGKTEIDGKVYSLSTTLEDIGESRRGWAIGSKVLFIADSGLNTIFVDTGDATKLDAKFEKANGITDETEYFLNFGTNGSYKTSDYKIKYVVITATKDAADELKADNGKLGTVAAVGDGTYSYTREIAPESVITDADRTNIRTIFYVADLTKLDDIVDGEVYVGTQSKDDISDEISYKQFLAKYVDTADSAMTITSTDNGEWLKVIDNDGDGNADYVLKTEYVLDEVTSYSNRTKSFSFYSKLEDSEEYAPVYLDGYEPEVGDVVIYALIDGNAYIELAATEVATIKTVSYKSETITTTNGDTYGQSGIFNETDYAQDITNAADKTQYNLYFDKFGYVRAYNEVEGSTAYGLLTEAYTTNTQNGRYVTTTIGIAETKLGENALEEYVVTNYNKGNNYFFTEAYDTGKTTNAGRIIESELLAAFAKANGTPDKAITNVAKYTLNDDGISIVSPAKLATDRAGKQLYYTDATRSTKTTVSAAGLEKVYAVNYVELDETVGISAKAKTYDVVSNENDHVNAVHDTEFYLVNTTTGKVTYFTDYTNVPAIASDNITAIYAVAENTTADQDEKDYWVANVIVIEVTDWSYDYDSISLAFYNDIKNSDDIKYLDTLNNVTEGPEATVVPKNVKTWAGQWRNFGFYALYETETETSDDDITITASRIERINEGDYNKNGIYAGTIERLSKIAERGGYIEVDKGLDKANIVEVATYEVPFYAIQINADGVTEAVELYAEDVKAGDDIIWVMDGKNVAYIVDLTYSTKKTSTPDWLLNLDPVNVVDSEWEYIMREQNPAPVYTVSLTDLTGANLKADLSAGTQNSTISVKVAPGENTIVGVWFAPGYEAKAGEEPRVTVVGKATGDVVYSGLLTAVETDDTKGLTYIYNITNINEDLNVRVSGDADPAEYTITYQIAAADADKFDGTVPAAETFDITDLNVTNLATITAKAGCGYRFAGWVDAEGIDVPAISKIGDVTLTAKFVKDEVSLTVEYYDEAGKITGVWIDKDNLPRDKAVTVKVDAPAKYSVNGEPQGYVLNGEIVLDMDENTMVVVTYVDSYAVELKVQDSTDRYDDTWNINLTASNTDSTVITSVATNATTVNLNVKHSTASTMTQNRTLIYSVDGTDTTKTVSSTTADFTVTLGALTSDGYVITVTSID